MYPTPMKMSHIFNCEIIIKLLKNKTINNNIKKKLELNININIQILLFIIYIILYNII